MRNQQRWLTDLSPRDQALAAISVDGGLTGALWEQFNTRLKWSERDETDPEQVQEIIIDMAGHSLMEMGRKRQMSRQL